MADWDDPLDKAKSLIEGGRSGDAVKLLEAMHGAGRGGLLLQIARVQAFIAHGDIPQALSAARDASTLNPNVAAAAVVLGQALLAAGHLPTAIGEFQRALRLDPDFSEARFRLGCAWLEAGEADKAAGAFADIPADVTYPLLEAKRAEIAAVRTRPRSDARYVCHLFDQFSSDYDARMVGQLGYGAPAILRDLAELIGLTRRGKRAILDLGCGTGLAGVAFADLASRLDGIDLSPAMIAKAEARKIYNSLRVGDIEGAVAAPGLTYDLVIAADTLVYLGDLAPLFCAVSRVLARDGAFLFTVERKDGEGYELGPKRRWRHAEPYLRSEAAEAGLAIAGFLECHPRSEAGSPVEGYAVALARR